MKLRQQPRAEEGGGAPLTHFFPDAHPRAPAPPGWKSEPRGANQRGVGGPHAPHPQPRPGGKRAGRGSTPPRGAPGARGTSRRLAARVCKAPPPPRPRAPRPPAEGKGAEEGEEAVNSPSVRASPRRAPLLGPGRGPPGPSVRPGAGPPWAQGTGGESCPLPRGLPHLTERSQQQRRGKSGLTCHYFLRHLGSTCQRPHKALWVRKSL